MMLIDISSSLIVVFSECLGIGGCSYYVCLNKDWLTTYDKIDGGNVLMRNDVLCKAIGISLI